MALIEVCVRLHIRRRRCTPQVRIWLDLRPECGLESEIELPLRSRDGERWLGAFALPSRGRGAFLYRVGLSAHAGADWSLSFHDRSTGRELLTDADGMDGHKIWLTGDCCLGYGSGDGCGMAHGAPRPRPAAARRVDLNPVRRPKRL